MTVGELRAALEGVRDDAVLLVEDVSPTGGMLLSGAQFSVRDVLSIGSSTDDPGFVLHVLRTR